MVLALPPPLLLGHHNIRLGERGCSMAEKLQQGNRFPSMTFDLVEGGKLRIPEDMPGRYAAVLFYRGHW